jgi:hypothetical protein
MASSAEITFLARQIYAFHKARSRKIVRYFRRPRSAADIRLTLEELGVEDIDSWSSLYGTFDGVDPGDKLSRTSGSVFLEWTWESLEFVVDVQRHAHQTLGQVPPLYFAFSTGGSYSLALAPNAEGRYDDQAIVCTGPGQNSPPVAFDDLVGMLRSVHAAYSRGLVSYDDKDKVRYDRSAVGRLVAEFNVGATYWHQFE